MKNKAKYHYWILIISSIIIILTVSCKKEDPEPILMTLNDIDGNIYQTVLIGEQRWMAENLKTTRYRDGSAIEFPGDDSLEWENNTNGAYAWYNNDPGNKNIYGALYNWYAVTSDKELCPAGWHVSTSADWARLISYLMGKYKLTNNEGDMNAIGNKLKSCYMVNSPLGGECSTETHPRWDFFATTYGTDDYNFSALPGGDRLHTGGFTSIGVYGFWWSVNTTDEDLLKKYHYINYDRSKVFSNFKHKNYGQSVRCVRND